MKIISDTHTHTMVCDHAYSTVRENLLTAASKGLRAIAITDHAYGAPDSCNNWHFGAMWIWPRKAEGVYLLRGAEANIMDMDGNLDLTEGDQKSLDLIVASLHSYCVKPEDADAHTRAWLGAIANPYVDILGHPAWPDFPFDEECVIKALADSGKLMEINPHAMLLRPQTVEQNRRLLSLCRRYGASVAVGSDAHICYEVAEFDAVYRLFEETSFPEELVWSASLKKVLSCVNQKAHIKNKFDLPEDC